MTRRLTSSETVRATARCKCGKVMDGKNALALAAQHHDTTGHAIETEIVQRIVYGGGAGAERGSNQKERLL